MKTTATRTLEFDAGHRLVNHESKCAHCHGHRYKAEVTCEADTLDSIGRVIDFSAIKAALGSWIDTHWDHAMVVNETDRDLLDYLRLTKQRHYVMATNPTAENMAEHLMVIGNQLLLTSSIRIVKIKLWETPNCYVEVTCEN